jgi:hypothetical protein
VLTCNLRTYHKVLPTFNGELHHEGAFKNGLETAIVLPLYDDVETDNFTFIFTTFMRYLIQMLLVINPVQGLRSINFLSQLVRSRLHNVPISCYTYQFDAKSKAEFFSCVQEFCYKVHRMTSWKLMNSSFAFMSARVNITRALRSGLWLPALVNSRFVGSTSLVAICIYSICFTEAKGFTECPLSAFVCFYNLSAIAGNF